MCQPLQAAHASPVWLMGRSCQPFQAGTCTWGGQEEDIWGGGGRRADGHKVGWAVAEERVGARITCAVS